MCFLKEWSLGTCGTLSLESLFQTHSYEFGLGTASLCYPRHVSPYTHLILSVNMPIFLKVIHLLITQAINS